LFMLATSVVALSIRDVSVSLMLACAYSAQNMRSSFKEPIPVAFRAITIPKIDGEYDAALVKTTDSAGNTIMVDEWNDTQRQRMHSYFVNETAGGSAIAYFSMKFDENYLYVLVDFPTNAYPGYNPNKPPELVMDAFSIAFDTKCNGGALPQTDDYIFTIAARPRTGYFEFSWYVRQGTGEGWSQILADPSHPAKQGFQAWPGVRQTNNNYTRLPHMFGEFRFSRRILGNETLKARAFAYDVDTDIFAVWPKEALTTRNIDLYGSIALSTQTIPEFPTQILAVLAAVGLILAFNVTRRKDLNHLVRRHGSASESSRT